MKRHNNAGIYMIRSEKLKLVGFWGSRDIGVRIRKLRSDYKLGRRLGLLERMGLRFASDVTFEKADDCPVEMIGVRIRRLVEEYMEKGYQVYGWTGEVKDPGAGAGIWGPCERLRRVAERFGIGDAEMEGMVDTLERGIEHNRSRG